MPMMRQPSAWLATFIAATILAVALLPGSAPARGTLDQTTFPTILTGVFVLPTLSQSQTFTAGRSGYLDTVALALDAAQGRYRLSIQPTTASGIPNGTMLASRTIDSCRL